MIEIAGVEAARAAGMTQGISAVDFASRAQQVADPAAIAAFEEAMATPPTAEIPFAAQISQTWGAAQANYQETVHRIHALTSFSRTQALSSAQLSELQYEVQNLSFQQEIVTNIAKKATDAITTLVKNG